MVSLVSESLWLFQRSSVSNSSSTEPSSLHTSQKCLFVYPSPPKVPSYLRPCSSVPVHTAYTPREPERPYFDPLRPWIRSSLHSPSKFQFCQRYRVSSSWRAIRLYECGVYLTQKSRLLDSFEKYTKYCQTLGSVAVWGRGFTVTSLVSTRKSIFTIKWNYVFSPFN